MFILLKFTIISEYIGKNITSNHTIKFVHLAQILKTFTFLTLLLQNSELVKIHQTVAQIPVETQGEDVK